MGSTCDMKADAMLWPNLNGLIRLSIGFLLLFVAVQEAQNIVPEVLGKHGLGDTGFDAMGIYGAIQLPVLAFGPVVLRWASARHAIVFSGFCVCLWAAILLVSSNEVNSASRLALQLLLLCGALVTGACATFLWPAQGVILSEYSSTKIVINRYASFFAFCIWGSGFVGPAVSYALLTLFGRTHMVWSLTVISLFGVCLLVQLPEPDLPKGVEEDCNQLPNRAEASQSREQQPIRKKLVIHEILLEGRAWRLAVLDFSFGMCFNAWIPRVMPLLVAAWSPMNATEDDLAKRLQWALLMNGLGHIVASVAFASIADRWGRCCAFGVQFATSLLVLTLCGLQLSLGQGGGGNCAFPFVVPAAFLAGFTFVMSRIAISALTTFHYADRAADAFTFMTVARFLGNIVGFFVLSRLPLWLALIGPVTSLALATLACIAHAPLFAEHDQDIGSVEDNIGCGVSQFQQLRCALFTNYPCWAAGALQGLHAAGHRASVVLSSKPEIAEICAQYDVRFVLFPVSPEVNMIRACKENPEYRAGVEDAYDVVRSDAPDLLLTCGFYVLPNHVLSIPKVLAFNMHPSDLPRYRGGFPMQAYILRNEPSFRVCLHKMTDVIDDPTSVLSRSSPLAITSESTVPSMIDQIAGTIPKLICDAMHSLLLPTPPSTPTSDASTAQQDPTEPLPHSFGTKTEKFTDPATGNLVTSNAGISARTRIEWELDSADSITRAARAFVGNLGLYTDYAGHTWKVEDCKAASVADESSATESKPGQVIGVRDLGEGAAEVTAVCVDGLAVLLTGRFKTWVVEVPVRIQVGQFFHSCTPVSTWLGQRGVDWVPGGTRYA